MRSTSSVRAPLFFAAPTKHLRKKERAASASQTVVGVDPGIRGSDRQQSLTGVGGRCGRQWRHHESCRAGAVRRQRRARLPRPLRWRSRRSTGTSPWVNECGCFGRGRLSRALGHTSAHSSSPGADRVPGR
jgi:hypothetical protein